MAALFRRMQSLSQPAGDGGERIKVIRAGVGNTVRMSLRALVSRVDGVEFVQVHRSVVVNARHMASATKDELGHFTLKLRNSPRTVKVSRAFRHLFRPL